MRPTSGKHYCFWLDVLHGFITFGLLAKVVGSSGVDEIGTSIPELLELRGFNSKSHCVTSNGYSMDIIRIINPLVPIATKTAVIFVHGMNKNGAEFIKNSVDIKPKDLSDIKVANESIEHLRHSLANDPASKSLALLLSNFGHDVWLWNRRAASSSFPHRLARDRFKRALISRRLEAHLTDSIGLAIQDSLRPVANPDFWKFSFDEQALEDMPKIIDFVLDASGFDKVSLVGYSGGGAITLMMLSKMPQIGNKLRNVVLYAPAFHLGNDPEFSPIEQSFKNFEPLFNDYNGPIDVRLFRVVGHTIETGLCRLGIRTDKTCGHDGNAGYSGGQNIDLPEDDVDVASSHEVAHLLQSIAKTRMHRFDYDSKALNIEHYGTPEPPSYNASEILFDRLSIWQGNTDALVTIADTKVLLESLKVNYDYHLVQGVGINFNHDSFLLHQNVSTLVNIPVLKILES